MVTGNGLALGRLTLACWSKVRFRLLHLRHLWSCGQTVPLQRFRRLAHPYPARRSHLQLTPLRRLLLLPPPLYSRPLQLSKWRLTKLPLLMPLSRPPRLPQPQPATYCRTSCGPWR